MCARIGGWRRIAGEDAGWFFGRERSTEALVAQLRAAEKTGGLVMLVGASGAGKSSLLNAGLVPALQNGAAGDGKGPQREVLQFVPGGDPLAELARRIPGLARVISAAEPVGGAAAAEVKAAEVKTAPGGKAAAEPGTPHFADAVREAAAGWAQQRETPAAARPVVIVDQFEETFTLCADETARRTFIQLLHAVCTPSDPGAPAPALVILGVRADFYEQCLGHPELADALQHRHMVLGPLTTTELRETVTGPARAVGLELEPGLAELIVREVSAGGSRRGA